MDANPIDAARTAITPALLDHPAATGAGIRVAILDTGLDLAVIQERHPQARITANSALRNGVLITAGPPSSLHGSTVADIILADAPQVELFSLDLFGISGHCDVETLIAGIRQAVEVWGVNVVNLSLGVIESQLLPPARRLLARTIDDAYHRDVIVVAAAHNDHPFTISLPASQSPPIISVDKATIAGPVPMRYQPQAGIEFAARAVGRLGVFSREPATSWAAPHATAVIAKILSMKPGMKPFELKTMLYWMSAEPEGNRADHRSSQSARDSIR
jgi:hypothetical protein